MLRVFIGRQIEVARGDFSPIRPSVEEDDDEIAARKSGDELVSSDLLGYDSCEDEDLDESGKDEDEGEEVGPWFAPGTREPMDYSNFLDLRVIPTLSDTAPQGSTSSSSRPKRELRPRQQKDTLEQVTQGAIRKSGPAATKTQRKKKKTSPGKPAPAAHGRKNKEWEVEEIVDSVIEADTLKHFYRVKWKRFSSQHNTWEPKVNLRNCQALIEAYEKKPRKQT